MDMTDQQKAAGRRVLSRFPTVKLDISRGTESAELIPYLVANPAERGAPVTVVYGGTSTMTIDKELNTSCRILVEPS